MKIGIPTEIKPLEGRVALIPAAAGDLVKAGHEVYVQSGAGVLAGFGDADYQSQAVQMVPTAQALYKQAKLIVKVKEPVEPEMQFLRKDHVLFSYLHLAALPELTKELQRIGLTAIGFETVVGLNNDLPLLKPMSDIAGRLSIQIGAQLLHRPQGGKGLLLGGLPAAPRGTVVVLGAGVAGSNAARMAANLGADVIVLDKNLDRLEEARAMGNNVTALYPFQEQIAQAVAQADLLIGAVLIPGAKAPHLVTQEMVRSMQRGSVIIDIAVDQGGCIETIRPTNYEQPTYVWEGIVHFGVTNMPGAVPRTACYALSSALLPFIHQLALPDWQQHVGLCAGINVQDGKIVHPALLAG